MPRLTGMSLCPDSVIEPALPGKESSAFSPTTIGAVEVIVALVLITPSIKTPSVGKTASASATPKPCEVAKDVPAPASAIALGATGTPEPGGLLWEEVLPIIKTVCKVSNIIGVDINELAPIKNFDSYNFLVAKLAYKILSYIFEFKR